MLFCGLETTNGEFARFPMIAGFLLVKTNCPLCWGGNEYIE